MQVHRFRNWAGIHAGDGKTAYLTADNAEKAGRALLAIAESIRTEEFMNSSGLTVQIDEGKGRDE